jgi:hypothetical protein
VPRESLVEMPKTRAPPAQPVLLAAKEMRATLAQPALRATEPTLVPTVQLAPLVPLVRMAKRALKAL